MPEKRVFCFKCGKELKADDIFCRGCGNRVANPGEKNGEHKSFDKGKVFRVNQNSPKKGGMSFFRFFFSIVALALIGYFIYIYAKPETKEADNIDQELQMEKDQEIGKTKADDHNDLLKIPEKLSMEQQRMMKDDSIVVIDFKQAGIQLNEERTLIQELFPSAKIEPADASEVFTAYNLWIGQKQYHVISTYTRFGEGFVIDKIYFVTGGFSTRNIHKILAPSEPELN